MKISTCVQILDCWEVKVPRIWLGTQGPGTRGGGYTVNEFNSSPEHRHHRVKSVNVSGRAQTGIPIANLFGLVIKWSGLRTTAPRPPSAVPSSPATTKNPTSCSLCTKPRLRPVRENCDTLSRPLVDIE